MATILKKSSLILFVFIMMICSTVVPSVAAPTADYKDFEQRDYVDAELVKVNDDGSLTYNKDSDSGSSLPDYSAVGYHSGEKVIPKVKVVKTIQAGSLKDHTKLIQDAIDEVSKLPVSERGTILLKAGVYIISKEIKICETGIVLRGEGQGVNGTVIYDSRNQKANTLELSGSGSYKVIDNSVSEITDNYVPMGQAKIHISQENIAKYKVGDSVLITLSPNEKWIETLGVDQLSGNGIPWKPEEYVMKYEREIVEIKDNEITLDTSVTMSIDKELLKATVSLIKDAGRISECGIENIRFVSFYDSRKKNDEAHGWGAVVLKNCRNCWVSDVASYNYGYSCVSVNTGSRNITVQYCSFLEPISQTTGGRKYSFIIAGASYVLIKNCYSSSSRHDYAVQSRTAGPNVFYSSVADESNSVSEPHHRWGTGTLYDNVYQVGVKKLGYFQAIMRGNSGTGHGWAGVNTVFWNSLSPGTVVRKPQTEQNFAIGAYGLYGGSITGINEYKKWYVAPENESPDYPTEKSQTGSPLYGNGYIESWYNPVNPSSLYQAQLSYKLKKDATAYITPPSPILNYPVYNETVKDSEITVSGICDLNAQKIIVNIGGKKTEITPNITEKSGKFSVKIKLKGGYHEVSVSQVIAGFESEKTPTRTVYINNGDKYDKPVKDIQTVLVERGNAAVIEIRNEKIQGFIDDATACEKTASENFDEAVEALLKIEKYINNNQSDELYFAGQDLKHFVSKIEENVTAISKIADQAKAFGCDEKSMKTINSLVDKTEKHLTNANIILTRGNREIQNKKVDFISYEKELQKDKKSPALTIVLITAGVVLLGGATLLITKKKKISKIK